MPLTGLVHAVLPVRIGFTDRSPLLTYALRGRQRKPYIAAEKSSTSGKKEKSGTIVCFDIYED